MQRTIKSYLVISTVVAAILLAFTSERFNEAIQVINWHAGSVLKQTRDDNAKQAHVSAGDQQQNEDEKARDSLARILAKAQTEAMHVTTEIRIIAAWLLVNAVLLWWFFGKRNRVDAGGTTPN